MRLKLYILIIKNKYYTSSFFSKSSSKIALLPSIIFLASSSVTSIWMPDGKRTPLTSVVSFIWTLTHSTGIFVGFLERFIIFSTILLLSFVSLAGMLSFALFSSIRAWILWFKTETLAARQAILNNKSSSRLDACFILTAISSRVNSSN